MDNGLVRAGRYVVNRRVALGYKHRIDLANDLPITDRTLADIENGAREVSVGTYAVLENKLGWGPGSIEAVRAGREPIEANTATVQQRQLQQHQQQPPPPNPLKSIPTEELLLELRRRIVWDHVRFDGDDRGWGALFPRGVDALGGASPVPRESHRQSLHDRLAE
jgi:hypothetical protein